MPRRRVQRPALASSGAANPPVAPNRLIDVARAYRPPLFHLRPCDVLIPVVVLLLLTAPALFTSRGFVDDWVNHLWLTWRQSREIRATGIPTLFLNADPIGVFYPNFLFYGGTLYAVGGYLMVLTGSPVAVFVGILTAAFCAAYGGMLWISRQAGVVGVAAHIPSIIVVTGAYYLSLAYGRGSWPELIATSAIPVLVAASLRSVSSGPSPGPVIALGLATIFWSGSHNISLAWGSIFLGCLAAALLLAWAPRLTVQHLRRMAFVAGVLVSGIMLNGWFLLPDITYSLRTGVAHVPGIATALSDPFSRLSIVFDPFRPRASSNSYLRSHFTELPVLVIAWALIASGLLWRATWRVELRRLLLLLVLLIGGLLVLLLDENVWKRVPAALAHIQFTFRLQTYIVMAIAGVVAVLLGKLAEEGSGSVRHRSLSVSLALVILFGLALGCWQVWNSDAGYYPGSPAFLKNRSMVLRYPSGTPPSWYVYALLGSFRDASAPVVATQGAIHLDPDAITGDRTTQTVSIPAGVGPVGSNIAAPPQIVTVRGLKVAGRTNDGYMAFLRPSGGQRTVRLTVMSARTPAMRLAPIVTLLGLLGFVGAVIASAITAHRRRGDEAIRTTTAASGIL